MDPLITIESCWAGALSVSETALWPTVEIDVRRGVTHHS